MLLRRKINLITLSATLLMVTGTYFVSIWALGDFLSQNTNDQKQALVSSITKDIEVFETILVSVEKKWDAELANSLPEIAKRLNAIEIKASSQTIAKLKNLRQEFNLSDIHLINANFIVFASTLNNEIGLDMSSFSPDYTSYLQQLFNSANFSSHQMSLSTSTGKFKKFAYYSLPGSEILVNADIDVKDRLQNNENDELSEYLFGDYVDKLESKYQSIKSIDLFLISNVDAWSLLREGREIDASLARQLFNGQATVSSSELKIYQQVEMRAYDAMGLKAFLKIEFDDSLLVLLKTKLQYSLLAIAVLIAIMGFLLLQYGVRKALLERFNDLLKQINQREVGDKQSIIIGGNDELAQIGHAVNGVMQRIEKQLLINKNLLDISHTDFLTSLANRRHFDEQLKLEWADAQRNKTPFSIIMVDVDKFKDFNDRYGHQEGDNCLRQVSDYFHAHMSRPRDFAARYGGEEFLCLLPETDAAGAAKIANELCKGIEKIQIPHESSDVSEFVTVSLGCLSVTGSKNYNEKELLKRVDNLLYSAKRNGRNCYVCESL